jgi:uncharacterized protein YbbK (DUF523 family)
VPPRVLVSSCLLGAEVRYHGGSARIASEILERWQREGRIVPVCPEVAGGLGTPRPPAEIVNGTGALVLAGSAAVRTNTGVDVTDAFRRGASHALRLAAENGIRIAVLKSASPSCGIGAISDGTFTGTKMSGDGVTAAALRDAGVQVFSEMELREADAALRVLDREER